MISVLVVCPSPSCPSREVKDGEVLRRQWEATWHEPLWLVEGEYPPGEWASDITCPSCSTEGIDPESGQLDSAEEELGERCPHCGIVSANMGKRREHWHCPHCRDWFPVKDPA